MHRDPLTIRLNRAERKALDSHAARKGLSAAGAVRMLLLERLESPSGSKTPPSGQADLTDITGRTVRVSLGAALAAIGDALLVAKSEMLARCGPGGRHGTRCVKALIVDISELEKHAAQTPEGMQLVASLRGQKKVRRGR
jgi:hypothetical protein